MIGLCIIAIIAIFVAHDIDPTVRLFTIGYFVIGIIFLASCMSTKWIKFVLRVR
jgi:hypothetical protein